MKGIAEDDKVTIRTECRAPPDGGGGGGGEKHLEKVEVKTREVDTVKYVERKLVDKGVGRMERHPADGLPLKHDHKKGRGGKFTWMGPDEDYQAQLEAEPALDDKDPNYVDDDDDKDRDLVAGEVEVAKTAAEGVARVEMVECSLPIRNARERLLSPRGHGILSRICTRSTQSSDACPVFIIIVICFESKFYLTQIVI
ncbi:uncharacterized protein LOC127252123 [Andrographis paniculata]|uniref:uncharacterized protein LOC127252123 n=1 Tax=Andrographis paniculata TaxID=175694 RepID=UPI0021E92AE2|nr:uncharacterized protein LOC127252123 [Andrographis paniculata]